MDTTGVVDWSQVQELRELQEPNEPDIVAELIATFLEDSELRMTRLLAAADAGDANTVIREAHTVKGNAALFGAEKLRGDAERVERGAALDLAAALPFVTEMRASLSEVQAILARGVPQS
jgi:HPt (histidine-containing phosphotransfer) domain-containing protein